MSRAIRQLLEFVSLCNLSCIKIIVSPVVRADPNASGAIWQTANVPRATPAEFMDKRLCCGQVVLVAVEGMIPVERDRAGRCCGLNAAAAHVARADIFCHDGLHSFVLRLSSFLVS